MTINKGQREFSNRFSILSMWQELALNFYPQRANFTQDLTIGRDFLSHLTSSIPVIMMRGLHTTVSSMLRPRDKDWFTVTTDGVIGHDSRKFLEFSNEVLRYFIYKKDSGFVKAIMQADVDFLVFGNSVKYICDNKDRTGLLIQAIHLKDVCWFENEMGVVNEIYRRVSLSAYEAIELFSKDKLHKSIIEAYEKKDNTKFTFYHIMIQSNVCPDLYKKFGSKFPWVSLWVDIKNNEIVEEVGSYTQKYVVARWQTVSGFQYGFSSASQIALPDARLFQSMMLTALEASQNAVLPPYLAQEGVIRGDVNLFSGGITLVDKDYDERLGGSIRPLTIDKGGLNHGLQMMDLVKSSLSDALFESKLNLPPIDATMTATEVMQRVKEYARTALPLFAPIEEEDNATTIEICYDILLRGGAFGFDIPAELSGKDVKFEFLSPIQDSSNDILKTQYSEMLNISAQTMQISPDATVGFDIPKAFNYLMDKTGIPTEWVKSKDEMEAMLQEKQMQQQILQASQMAQQAGAGGQALKGALGG